MIFLEILFFWFATLSVGMTGCFLIFKAFNMETLSRIPLVPLWFVAVGTGSALFVTVYAASVRIFAAPQPGLVGLCILAFYSFYRLFNSLKQRKNFIRIKRESAYFILFFIFVVFFTMLHKSIGNDHAEMHAPLAEAIKHGHLPVKNAANPNEMGIDITMIQKELDMFYRDSKRDVNFPVHKMELEKNIFYHYLEPVMLSLFRILTFGVVPYPLLELCEIVLFKVVILASVFVLLLFLFGKEKIAFWGAVIFGFSGNWTLLFFWSDWIESLKTHVIPPIKIMGQTYQGALPLITQYYRDRFGTSISFGTFTQLQYNVMLMDFMYLMLLFLCSYVSYVQERYTLLCVSLMLFIPPMLMGTGYTFLSAMMVVIFMVAFLKILVSRHSYKFVVCVTFFMAVALSFATVHVAPKLYNRLAPEMLALIERSDYAFYPLAMGNISLFDIRSIAYLFLQTGTLMLYVPLALLYCRKVYEQAIIHSLFLASIPLVMLTLKFNFNSLLFSRPELNMIKFWTVAFLFYNLIVSVAWCSWMATRSETRLLKTFITLPIAVSIFSNVIFLGGVFVLTPEITFYGPSF